MEHTKTIQNQHKITTHLPSWHKGFTKILLFSLATLSLCVSNASWCTDHVQWAVVGAGPTGIAALGLILDSGVSPEKVLWLDREFNVGSMGKEYRNVPGNANVSQYIAYVHTCKIFGEVKSDALDRLFAMPLNQTPKLCSIVEPLLDITNYLRTKVLAVEDEMIALDFRDNQWHIQTKTLSFCADNVVLATGAHPKNMRYEGIPQIPLNLALDKDILATCVTPDDTVAVIGSSHSALLVVKYLTELSVASIINFYKKPYTYPTLFRGNIAWQESGLKGDLALWTKTVLEVAMPKNLVRVENTPETFQSLLPKCTKVICAIGFERNDLPPINGDLSVYEKYDVSSGMIGPRLFGLGIAFPQQRIDPLGNVEYLVGLPYLTFDALRLALNNQTDAKKRLVIQEKQPHIPLQEGTAGIRSLFIYRPETSKPLNELAEILLVGDSSLTRGEREIIASYVSYLNECKYCCTIHSAIATELLNGDTEILQAVKKDYTTAPISEKLKTLLVIAAKVQKDARTVSDEDVRMAHVQGATDLELHDTVLIAAAFCMYNRYVDGLATWAPQDPKFYEERAKLIAQNGYAKLNALNSSPACAVS